MATLHKQLYVVKYIGYGDETLEVIVKSYKDFLIWLKKHNEDRIDDDDDSIEETEQDFELIPLWFTNYDVEDVKKKSIKKK